MNEERLKELEAKIKTSDFGLKNRDAQALINRVRELERALETEKQERQAVKGALIQAVGYLREGKSQFTPTTTNSFVDDFINKWGEKL